MKSKLYIFMFFSTMVLISCSSVDEFDINAKQIDTYLESNLLKKRPHLKIKNDAFERDFMFYGNFIPMLNSPTGHSLKGRIIQFQLFGDHVIMLESPKGHSIGDKESTIMLADFPVLESDTEGVTIDFAKGMNSAFTMRNVHSRSVSEREQSGAEQFRAVFLSGSFIKSVEAKDDVLTVSQIAQWRNQKSELISAEFRYFFREYLPSRSFKKKTYGKHRFVQYFSTPPLVESPTTQAFAYIAKWDLRKPIVFHISANTPHQYKDAIRDGILFWNHIFQKNILEVRDLPSEISAPHPRLNILQWVVWDNEASAYADMVVDHLTGEIKQAQIYLRSGWVIQSASKLRNQLEELLLLEQEPLAEGMPAIEEHVPLPAMFDYEDPCFKTMNRYEEISEMAMGISQNPIADETLVVLTGDILRAVIAHEMGHVLGLRHNLSASIHGTISLKERDELFINYLQTSEYDLSHDKFLSRSIMDVFSAPDDAIVGAQIREILQNEDVSSSSLSKIYAFDKQAIDFGYFEKPMLGDIPFCTDDDIPRFLDCRRWDASDMPLVFASARLNSMLTQVAIVLADTFIGAIDPRRKGGPLAVRDIPLTTQGVLKIADQYIKEVFSWFNQNGRSAKTEIHFPAFGPQNQEEITKARFKDVRDQVNHRGVEQLFALMPPFRTSNMAVEMSLHAFTNHFRKRIDAQRRADPDFIVADVDFEQAITIARKFFEHLNNDIIFLVANIVGRAQFDDPDFQIPIEDALGKIAREIILSTDKSSQKQKLPQFVYETKIREAAVQLLNPSLGIFGDMSLENYYGITSEIKLIMRRIGMPEGSETSIDLSKLSRPERQWMLEQNRILNALMQIRTMTRKSNPPPG